MENVRGLISSKIQGRHVIKDILRDLSRPTSIYGDENSDIEYKLVSLSQSGVMSLSADTSAFVVKAEEYGVPQARHRIFVLGVRNDIDIMPRILEKVSTRTTVKDEIGDLTKIRSGMSKQADSSNRWVETLTETMHQPWFAHGRENGMAKLIAPIERVLALLKQQESKQEELKKVQINIQLQQYSRIGLETIVSKSFCRMNCVLICKAICIVICLLLYMRQLMG